MGISQGPNENRMSSRIGFGYPGNLTTETGTWRHYLDDGFTVTGVYIFCTTAPTGAAILVDVNKNGTTIFTTQGNRPTIAISANADATVAVPDVTSYAAGDYITIDIDQIGSTVAGADMEVVIIGNFAS